MKEKAEAAYPEMFFFNGREDFDIDLREMAIELKAMAKNINCKLEPCERALVMFASYALAKQVGFNMKEGAEQC